MPNPLANPLGGNAELCELLLRIAGRSPGRMESARHHVNVLDAALPYMSQPQALIARGRIAALETKWGPLLPGAQTDGMSGEIPPTARVGRWLSRRRTPARYLSVLRAAAVGVLAGMTSLSDLRDHAFANETDHVLYAPGLDSFKEWLIELRIARRQTKGIYVPGYLCEWWVEEMIPTKAKGTPYQACLEAALAQRHDRRGCRDVC